MYPPSMMIELNWSFVLRVIQIVLSLPLLLRLSSCFAATQLWVDWNACLNENEPMWTQRLHTSWTRFHAKFASLDVSRKSKHCFIWSSLLDLHCLYFDYTFFFSLTFIPFRSASSTHFSISIGEISKKLFSFRA